MTPRRLLFIFLGALTLLRLACISLFELSPDEAYYYQWAQHLDICYYSKGPGVAVVIWLGTHLPFLPAAFGVRIFAPLLALGTSLLMFSFGRRLFGESVAIWTVLLLNVIPIFQVGGLIMTIDPLSMFFWMAALYTFWLALERSPEWNLWWPATGALIGLGFLCKYTNTMQFVSIVLLLAFTPKYRREFRRAGFWVMCAIFLIFTLPPVIWNAQHEWITIRHLTVRGHLEQAFHVRPGEFFKFLLMHFGVYSPVIFGAMLAALWWGIERAHNHFKPRFLVAFALPLLLLYFWLALRQAGEPNWTAPATLSLALLTVAIWHEMAQQKRWVRRLAASGLALGLVMSMLILDTDLLRQAGFPLSYDSDPGARLQGWRTTADLVDSFRKQFEAKTGAPAFLIANKYQTASELAFYLHDKRPAAPGHPPVYIPESQDIENQYSFWPRYDEVTDLAVIGHDFMAGTVEPNADPRLRAEVGKALETLEQEEKSDGNIAPDARRALVRALHAAAPQLPLDESFVEEQGPNLFTGRTALYITDRAEERAPSSIQRGFERAEMVACIDIKRHGLLLRQIRIFACYNYHGMSL